MWILYILDNMNNPIQYCEGQWYTREYLVNRRDQAELFYIKPFLFPIHYWRKTIHYWEDKNVQGYKGENIYSNSMHDLSKAPSMGFTFRKVCTCFPQYVRGTNSTDCPHPKDTETVDTAPTCQMMLMLTKLITLFFYKLLYTVSIQTYRDAASC